MDYVFTRGENRQWYLTALRDSEMQVEVTPIPAPTDAVVDNMQNEEMGTSDAASTEPAPVPEEGAEVAPDAENARRYRRHPRQRGDPRQSEKCPASAPTPMSGRFFRGSAAGAAPVRPAAPCHT